MKFRMFKIIGVTVALCLYFHLTLASPTNSRLPSDYGTDSQEGMLDTELGQGREMVSVLLLIKNQFREIIEDCALQVLKYVKAVAHHFKVKLLKRLGTYTLSDVFHILFDGVTDFVNESSPDDVYEIMQRPEPIVPSYGYRNPYGLATMFNSG